MNNTDIEFSADEISKIENTGLIGKKIADVIRINAEVHQRIMNVIKQTFCSEVLNIDSYKLHASKDGKMMLDVEYVVIVADSHTCVDYDEECTFPLEWLTDGYDVKTAFLKTRISEMEEKESMLESHKSTLIDDIDEINGKIEDIEAQMKEIAEKKNEFINLLEAK